MSNGIGKNNLVVGNFNIPATSTASATRPAENAESAQQSSNVKQFDAGRRQVQDQAGRARMMKALNAGDSSNLPPIITALKRGNLNEVKQLLLEGASIETKDADGNNLLMLAIKAKDPGMVSYLVKNGANTNATNRSGQDPAELALQLKNEELGHQMMDILLNDFAQSYHSADEHDAYDD